MKCLADVYYVPPCWQMSLEGSLVNKNKRLIFFFPPCVLLDECAKLSGVFVLLQKDNLMCILWWTLCCESLSLQVHLKNSQLCLSQMLKDFQ